MHLSKYEKKSALYGSVVNALSGGISIVASVVLARGLGVEKFGLFSYFLAKGALYSISILPGLNVVFSKKLIDGELEHVSSALTILFFLPLMLQVGYFILDFNSIFFLPLIYIGVTFGDFSFIICQTLKKFWLFNFMKIFNSIFMLVLGVYTCFWDVNVYDLFYIMCTAKFVFHALVLFFIFRSERKFSTDSLFDTLKSGFESSLVGLGYNCLSVYVNQILGVGSIQQSYYSLAINIPNKIKDYIKTVFNYIVLSRISDSRENYRNLSTFLSKIMIVSFFLVSLNFLLAKYYIPLFYGEGFSKATTAYSLYYIVVFLGVFSSYYMNDIVYFGGVSRFTRVSLFGALIDFVILYSYSNIVEQIRAYEVIACLVASRTLFYFFLKMISFRE